MKMTLAILVVTALAGHASANLTAWNISGGVAYDQNGVAIPTAEATAITLAGDQTALFSFGDIDLADFLSLTQIGDAQPLFVAPSFLDGIYAANGFTDTDAAVGTATLLVVNKTVSSLYDIEKFDWFGIAGTFELTERLLPGDPQPRPPQEIMLGDVTTNVTIAVPEPSTISLMGIAGVATFFRRRKQFR